MHKAATMDSVVSRLDGPAMVIGLLSLLLFTVFLSRRSKSEGEKRREAPLAGGAWPIIGHLPLLSSSNMPHYTLGALADKYGPVFTIRLGSKRALVISNWEMAKECFATNDLAVSTRPTLLATQQFSYNEAMFAFSPYGPYWREIRKIATLELLSNRRIQQMSPVRVSEVASSIKHLFRVWTEKQNESGRVLVDLSRCFGELAMNAVLRSTAGKRYFGGGADIKEEEEARRILRSLRDFLRLMGVFVLGDALPCLRWLDLGGHEKEMKKTAKELDAHLNEWLQEHRRKRASGEHRGDEDFMEVMMSVLDGSELGGYDADTIIKATASILIAGAVDTSTITLTWTICRLLSNPHVLKEAQKELDVQVGKERPVKESDISKLVYLQAIVKETLRLHPPAPLSGLRMFSEDCTIGGYHIKKGTRLMTNLWKIQTDPIIWSNPLEFIPERFLTTHKDIDVRGQHFEFIPFGSGRRICPGISFGLQTIHLTLASFLHSFEFSKPSDEPINMTEIFGLTTMKATPLEALIKPRLSSKLYDAL